MDRPSWAPTGIDLSRPSAARVYDYYLGGSHNFEVDRQMAREALRLWPDLTLAIQANRAFLGRAVRMLAEEGITQFLDIGSGIPTVGNVHIMAQRTTPDARVVYVDHDQVVVAHSRAILEGDERTAVVQADLREPESIFADEAVHRLLDLDQPVALLLVAVLHFVPDSDDPAGLVARLCSPLPSGSYLVMSHASADGQPELAATHQDLYRRTPTPMTMRTRSQIEQLFPEMALVPPGLTRLPLWRPDRGDADDDRIVGYAGVGRKA